MVKEIKLDNDLIRELRELGGFKSDSEAVEVALRECLTRRRQLGITQLFGKIDYDPAYDYKAERRRRRC